MSTPLRAALKETSSLLPRVVDRLGAVAKAHKALIHPEARGDFGDSLESDEAFLVGHEGEHRWDYLLGHTPSNTVVGLEPHSAYTSEVQVVIRKRAAALTHLGAHLRPGRRVDEWYWVASGRVDFVPHEKQVLLLAQNGVRFIGKQLRAKDLPSPIAAPGPPKDDTKKSKKRAAK